MSNLILGVEIGGTKLQLAVGTPEGEILGVHQGRVEPAQGGAGIREWLAEEIPSFLEAQAQKVSAIGCGFGGPLHTPSGRVLQSIQIDGWHDFPVRDWFEDTFHLPTTVDNDSNAAAWGEYKRGFGRGCRYFFYTNMGSGVGGGLVLDGKLHDGQGYGAGEFGHTWVPDWTQDEPGAAEIIEDICSGWSIEKRLRTPGYVPEESALFTRFEGDLKKVTARNLAEAARAGDAFALVEIDCIAESMGIGLANVLSLTGVERIAVGGGVAMMGDLLIDRIRKYTKQHEFVSSTGHYEISACELGEQIVLVGAILRAGERFGGLERGL